MDIIEFIPNRVCIKPVNGSNIECLSYNTITIDGIIHRGAFISLDKRYFFPVHVRPPMGWVAIRYNLDKQTYEFPDPDGGKPYTLYQQVIDMVDNILIERHLLKS